MCTVRLLVAAGLLAGAAVTGASAMPMANLPTETVNNVEQVRWVCGPYRCWWRPNYYGYYGAPRFYGGYGYGRRWGGYGRRWRRW